VTAAATYETLQLALIVNIPLILILLLAAVLGRR
jgi:hypothetical protein